MAVGILVVLVFLGNLVGFHDPDYWTHLSVGRLLWQTGHVPRYELFGYTVAGKPWIAHEWLSEAILYGLEHWLGHPIIVLAWAGLATLTVGQLVALLADLGVGRFLKPALLAVVLLMWVTHFAVRPQLFTWLFSITFLRILWRYHRQGDSSAGPAWRPTSFRLGLAFLPLLMALWANLHGGYVIGLVLVGLLLLSHWIEPWLGGSKRPWQVLTVVWLLCWLAPLISPFGVSLLLYPFTYLGHTNPSFHYVNEWQSPDFHLPSFWPLAFSIVVAVWLGLWDQRQRDPWPALVYSFMLAVALYSRRHIPLYALVWAGVVGSRLREQFPALAYRSQPSITPRQGARNWGTLLIASIALLVAVLLRPNLLLRTPLVRAGGFAYPEAGVSYLRDHRPDARIFNEVWWGGYLTWELWPRMQVFIDGRFDVYGTEIADDYALVYEGRVGWDAVLERYGVDTVMVELDAPLLERLAESDGWERAFVGPVEAVWIRRPEHQ
ncbi:MAG TPA: hypothetical protein EYH31_08020 [Anaerolineae bacterium]|nr:hypothetical protein [Anaerolineae bacterium]